MTATFISNTDLRFPKVPHNGFLGLDGFGNKIEEHAQACSTLATRYIGKHSNQYLTAAFSMSKKCLSYGFSILEVTKL